MPPGRLQPSGGRRKPARTRSRTRTRAGGSCCATRPTRASRTRRPQPPFPGPTQVDPPSCTGRARPGRCRTNPPCSRPTARCPVRPAARCSGCTLHAPGDSLSTRADRAAAEVPGRPPAGGDAGAGEAHGGGLSGGAATLALAGRMAGQPEGDPPASRASGIHPTETTGAPRLLDGWCSPDALAHRMAHTPDPNEAIHSGDDLHG